MQLNAYIRLMRLEKPIGIWLLWAPTAWALWLSSAGHPKLYLVIYFFLGTVLMRSAGCVINDIADMDVDKYVARTNLRPLTCGEITVTGAITCLLILLLMAGWILFQLPRACVLYAVLALLLTGTYPLTKRFFKAPQLVLGLSFSMSIPMVYTAVDHALDSTMWLLCIINILWILIYDTLYALVDRADDMRLGLYSTAITILGHEHKILRILAGIMHVCWLLLAIRIHLGCFFYLSWAVGVLFLFYQDLYFIKPNRNKYFQAFKNNAWYGFLMWFGLICWARCI